MSYSIDVNILLHASNTGSASHTAARAFLDECARRRDLLTLCWPTLMGFVRMATHPSIFARPLTPAEATRNVDALVRLPRARVVGEDDGFWETYLEVTEGHAIRGNLVPDAHLAALLRLHGVATLYTTDAGMRRYSFLRVENPLA